MPFQIGIGDQSAAAGAILPHARTLGVASAPGHRTQADHALFVDAFDFPQLALHANGGVGLDGLLAHDQGGEDLQELDLGHGAAAHVVVHLDHVRQGQRGQGREQVLVVAVDFLAHILDGPGVFHAVDAALHRAGTQRHQDLGLAPDLVDPGDAVGRRERSFDKGDVVFFDLSVHGLAPLDDVDVGQDVQQLVLEVQLVQLAAFATGEIENRHARFGGHHSASCRDLMSG